MSQNLQNFAKFQEFQLDNLVVFEKCCKSCQNALPYFLAKIGADTAENEQHVAEILPKTGARSRRPAGPSPRGPGVPRRGRASIGGGVHLSILRTPVNNFE